MKKKLEYSKSAEIVEAAVRSIASPASLSGDDLIGNVVTSHALREVLRERIRDEVRSQGFGIKWKGIPLEPAVTIKSLVASLTDLAGDPGVDDDLIDPSGEANLEGSSGSGGDPGVDDP